MKQRRVRLKRTVLALLIVVVLYALLGFVGVPLVVRKIVVPRLGKTIGREVRMTGMSFNPFLLRTRLAGFAVLESDGALFVGFDEATADLEFTKLVRGIIWVRDFRLSAPSVRVARDAEGRMNFQDIVERLASPEPETAEPAGPPPRFFVEAAGVSDGRIEWLDAAVDPPFAANVAPVSFDIARFGNLEGSENLLGVAAAGERGFTVDWEGSFDPSSLEGAGTLRVEGVLVSSFQPYVADYVRFRIDETAVDLELPYRVRLKDPSDPFAVEGARLELRDLRLQTADEQAERFFEIGWFEILGVDVGVGAHTVSAAGISVNDGSVAVRQSAEGEVNLLSLFRVGIIDETATGAPAAAAETAPSSSDAPAQPAWAFACERFGVTNFVIRAQDTKPARPLDVELAIETLAVTPVSSQLDQEAALEGSCRIGEAGELDLKGTFRLEPRDVEVAFQARSVPLAEFEAYLGEVLDVVLEQGVLNAAGTFTLQGTEPAVVAFNGDVAVEGLVVREVDREGEFFDLERIALDGLVVDAAASSVKAERVEIVAPVLELVVDTNGVLNVTALAHVNAAEEVQATSEEPSGQADGESGSEPAEADAGAEEAAAMAAESPAGTGWAISVPELHMEAGNFRFVDNRLDPPAKTALSEVSTVVRGFSTSGEEPTDVEISGRIDPFAEFSIAGRFIPSAFDHDASLRVRGSGIDLPPLSRYAGQFIGYGLAGGTLELDLEYAVEDRALRGENRITIRDLELGEESADPDAPDMPVGLAISMLEDRQGRIVLDVPVSGSLDDPSFDIGSVITKAVTSPITKVASAPFAVVGSMFGGREGQDLSEVAFAPGTARPESEERGKLDVLARALKERPGLSLEVVGCFDSGADREPLARTRLQDKLRALQASDPDLPQGSLENAEVYAALVGEAYARGSAAGDDSAPPPSDVGPSGGQEALPPSPSEPPPATEAGQEVRTTAAVRPAPALDASVPRGELRARALFGGGATERRPRVERKTVRTLAHEGPPATQPGAAAEGEAPSANGMETALLAGIDVGQEDFDALAREREQAVVDFFQSSHDLGPPRVNVRTAETDSSSGPVVRFHLK